MFSSARVYYYTQAHNRKVALALHRRKLNVEPLDNWKKCHAKPLKANNAANQPTKVMTIQLLPKLKTRHVLACV